MSDQRKVWNVALRVASERGLDGELSCACYNSMGQVRHVCIYCDARNAIEPHEPLPEQINVTEVSR